jgi:hypothetical protein
MKAELNETLKTVRKIRNNDHDSGTHYLLGYLWASLSEKEQKRIYNLFKSDLEEQEKNK